MALPTIGDGEQVGDGNTGEQLNVGNSTQPVRVGGSTSATVGFFGKTPAAQQAKPTALGTIVFSQVATSGKWAFSSSTVAKTVAPRIDALGSRLKNLGLMT